MQSFRSTRSCPSYQTPGTPSAGAQAYASRCRGASAERDAITMRAAQACGLVVANLVALECDLSFVCLAERAGEPVISGAWGGVGGGLGVKGCSGVVFRPILLKNSSGTPKSSFFGVLEPLGSLRSSILDRSERSTFALRRARLRGPRFSTE